MKICFLCSEYPPGPHGGIGTFTQVLGRALVRAGHEVRVIGAYEGNGAPSPQDDRGVQVWRVHQSPRRGGWVPARIAVYRQVAAWAARGEIDLVEGPDWMGPLAGWPRLPVPAVVRLNGSAVFFAEELRKPLRRTLAWLERASLRRADAWCSASQYTADVTRRLMRPREGPRAILCNPVEPAARMGGRARTSPPRVVFTGTLTEKKGVVSLVRAWPTVLARAQDAELHLFGKNARTEDGRDMQAYLEASLDPASRARVHFHGHVGRERLFQAFREAAVAVFPSYSEAFGIAPFEAMAHGCPTIYTRRGPGPELVRDRVDGMLVDPDQPTDIADAICRALADPAAAERLGEAGRRRVEETFTTTALLGKNEDFYAACIADFRGR
jgi:glycosyltransferase involved in cell wall biosynthesis